MPKRPGIQAILTAHVTEGRNLLGSSALDAYTWQHEIGTWYIKSQEIVADLMPPEMLADYKMNTIVLDRNPFERVSVEERLIRVIAWFENALLELP